MLSVCTVLVEAREGMLPLVLVLGVLRRELRPLLLDRLAVGLCSVQSTISSSWWWCVHALRCLLWLAGRVDISISSTTSALRHRVGGG